MTKQFVLRNVENNKYWTGEYYGTMFSGNIEDARKFFNEPEIESAIIYSMELQGYMFELVTIYSL